MAFRMDADRHAFSARYLAVDHRRMLLVLPCVVEAVNLEIAEARGQMRMGDELYAKILLAAVLAGALAITLVRGKIRASGKLGLELLELDRLPAVLGKAFSSENLRRCFIHSYCPFRTKIQYTTDSKRPIIPIARSLASPILDWTDKSVHNPTPLREGELQCPVEESESSRR